MYHFTVGMGLEYLVWKSRQKMKQYNQKHVSIGFVVNPITNNEVWDNANQKIDGIYDAGFNQNLLIIVFYKR